MASVFALSNVDSTWEIVPVIKNLEIKVHSNLLCNTLYSSEGFGGDKTWNFEVKPIDGTHNICLEIDYWVKLREKDDKLIEPSLV